LSEPAFGILFFNTWSVTDIQFIHTNGLVWEGAENGGLGRSTIKFKSWLMAGSTDHESVDIDARKTGLSDYSGELAL